MKPKFIIRGVKFIIRGVSGGWAGWAIAHTDFGRIEGAAGSTHRIMYYLPTHTLSSLLSVLFY